MPLSRTERKKIRKAELAALQVLAEKNIEEGALNILNNINNVAKQVIETDENEAKKKEEERIARQKQEERIARQKQEREKLKAEQARVRVMEEEKLREEEEIRQVEIKRKSEETRQAEIIRKVEAKQAEKIRKEAAEEVRVKRKEAVKARERVQEQRIIELEAKERAIRASKEVERQRRIQVIKNLENDKKMAGKKLYENSKKLLIQDIKFGTPISVIKKETRFGIAGYNKITVEIQNPDKYRISLIRQTNVVDDVFHIRSNGEFLVYNTHIDGIWGNERTVYYHSLNRINRSKGLTFVISPSDNNYDVKLNGQFIPIEFGAEGVDANVILLSKGDILLVE